MYKKRMITLTMASTLLLTSCASTGTNEGSNQWSTEAVAAAMGGAIGAIGSIGKSILKNEEIDTKEVVMTAAAGAVAGYFIGKELANMQNRYANKEQKLISEILEVDKESKILADRNTQLEGELSSIENEISNLVQDRTLGTSAKAQRKSTLRTKLEAKKRSFQSLIDENRQLSRNLANSQSKVNQYKYKPTDKSQIMSDIGKLDNNSKNYESTLNSKIAQIDTMLDNLA